MTKRQLKKDIFLSSFYGCLFGETKSIKRYLSVLPKK